MRRKPITSVHFQFLAGLSGNISNVSFGAMIGWLLITADGLQSKDRTHLAIRPISDLELTWVVSVFFLSAIVGSAYISWMADGYGKKHTLCHLSVAHFLSWGIYMLATNATEMYVAGAIGGFAVGGSVILVPLFIAEVAEDSVRGIISATTMLAVHVGMLISFVLLCFLSPQEATYGLISLPLIFVFSFVYFPDTPYQLRKEYRKTLSLESLYFYRGCREISEKQSDFMKKEVLKFEQAVVDADLVKANFVTRASVKAITLSMLVMLAQQLVANFFTLTYMNKLGMGFELSHNVLAVAWGAVQLIGCIVAYLTVESVGRKKILVVSLFATAIGFTVLGILLQLNSSAFDLSILIGFIALASSIGLAPISLVLATDLVPQKIRTMGVTIIITAMWVFGFALFQSNLAPALGLDIYSYLVAGVTLFVGLLLVFKLPETQGLSNDEIVWALER